MRSDLGPEASDACTALCLRLLRVALFRARPAEALDGNAIKATFFNGQPFIASSPTRQRYTMVFTPDGKATREPSASPATKSTANGRS